MLRVALTGGIATGKSHVLERFRARGVSCLDADVLAHSVTGPGTTVTASITARFGPGVLDGDGGVDRARLGPIVFAGPSARRELEAIVHPAVYRTIAAELRAFERTGNNPVAVVDVPLLYETSHAADFDRVIVTVCPSAVQRARLLERGLSEAEAEQRIAAQWPVGRKASRADFVIETGGTFDETDEEVDRVLQTLRDGRG